MSAAPHAEPIDLAITVDDLLIWARNYRFNWQPNYVFRKPIALPRTRAT